MSATPTDYPPPMPQRDDYVLCYACGTIAPVDRWGFLLRDLETGELMDADAGAQDCMQQCPGCGWVHTDDDGNPGISEYLTIGEAERELDRHALTYAGHWVDRWQEVLAAVAENYESAREACSSEALLREEAEQSIDHLNGKVRDLRREVRRLRELAQLALDALDAQKQPRFELGHDQAVDALSEAVNGG